jgi:hypothetical protein
VGFCPPEVLDEIINLFSPLICLVFFLIIIHPTAIITHTYHYSKLNNQNSITFPFLHMHDELTSIGKDMF